MMVDNINKSNKKHISNLCNHLVSGSDPWEEGLQTFLGGKLFRNINGTPLRSGTNLGMDQIDFKP